MYCKNCGKKLPDNARFCDRCNTSVRKKEDKMNLIEELKEERLARRKAQDIEEKIKEIKRVKNKKLRMIAMVIGAILGIGALSGVIVYINYSKTSGINTTEIELRTEEPQPTHAQAVVIGGGSASAMPQTTQDIPVVSDVSLGNNVHGYTDTTVSGRSFAYPSNFDKEEKDTVQLSLTDGEATITANKVITSLSPKELLRKYADDMGGDDMGSVANDTTYSVTLRAGNYICHRKGISDGSSEIYYEIKYRADSSNAAQYKADIEYMDEYFN